MGARKSMRLSLSVVDDPTVHDGEDRTNLPDLNVGHGEVIPVERDQIGQLARLDRSDLVFHAQEPAVTASEESESLLLKQPDIALGKAWKRRSRT